jgi:hypothetical protein
MTPEKFNKAQILSAEIRYLERFIEAIPERSPANCLTTVKVLYEDFYEMAIDYLNSDLFKVLIDARRQAEQQLVELKAKFEEL